MYTSDATVMSPFSSVIVFIVSHFSHLAPKSDASLLIIWRKGFLCYCLGSTIIVETLHRSTINKIWIKSASLYP